MTQRFIRTEQILGTAALETLGRSTVAVFGLGAVGSYALEALSRLGVGGFILIDFDEVKYSNFNRQLFALESTVGKLKASVAAERIRQINPAIKIKTYSDFADKKSLPEILSPAPDLVIDAIDSMSPKTELVAFCQKHAIALLSSMGAGARLDPFSLRIGDISLARSCPLARRLHRELKRKHGIQGGVRCVYSQEKPRPVLVAPKKEQEYYRRGRSRVPVGTVSYLPGMFGLMLAYEAMRMILGQEHRQCVKEVR